MYTQAAAFAVKSKLIFHHRFAEFAIAQHTGMFSTTTLTFKTLISNYCSLISAQHGPSSNNNIVLQALNQKFSYPVHIPALIQPQTNLSYGVYSEHD